MSTKQGIVTFLGSDSERNEVPSIRTLSADMSSMNWLQQNGFLSHVKKISSSHVINHDSASSCSSEGEENLGQEYVWRLIQSQKETRKTPQPDVWGTILTQNSENSVSSKALPPYVHPLVRKSSGSMSEKSLQICTESLGSETGSHGFLKCPSLEILYRGHDDEENRQIKEPSYRENFHLVKCKRAPARPVPPPLSSVSGGDSSSLRFHAHRRDGRLVLEAVAVPPRKYFHAQRGDGSLVLTLIHSSTFQEDKMEGDEVEEFESVSDNMEEADENLEESRGGHDGEKVAGVTEENIPAKEVESLVEQTSSLPSKMIKIQKSWLMREKHTGLSSMNPRWPHEFDKAGIFTDQEEEVARKEAMEEFPIPHSMPPMPSAGRQISLPPLPPPSATSTFNSYEHFWRIKTINSHIPQTPQTTPFKNKATNPNWRGCNKVPRSLTIWEPHSIATSG